LLASLNNTNTVRTTAQNAKKFSLLSLRHVETFWEHGYVFEQVSNNSEVQLNLKF